MADHKKNVCEPDSSLVSDSEDYEVQYFANENGITAKQTRELIGRFGNDRETLRFEAKKLRV